MKSDEASANPTDLTSMRARWISEIAHAMFSDLADAAAGVERWPEFTPINSPEVGLIMVHGRMGGLGGRFPLGECTVTRCMVQDDQGYTGLAYVLGDSLAHAEIAAKLDALLQHPERQSSLWDRIIVPLMILRTAREAQTKQENQSSRVQFFTMETMRS
ncbi:phosphonate C-P lyase system protein PhnG [Acidithiobacillus ferrooxidans]|uniref:phosphonate C-P lyase system protein PhnG n=1 Tax=Acidithiobacillus ferrooxidans TaxID=920 RepID=UPI00214CC822|nr:phosphonate C-P lyase system protein PhnG [Acidithiobacillus ferrooxidans]MCR2831681.1 phosphonate C-P lyase system protein PhnG [Acidithiobacillus ferrooxidans]